MATVTYKKGKLYDLPIIPILFRVVADDPYLIIVTGERRSETELCFE